MRKYAIIVHLLMAGQKVLEPVVTVVYVIADGDFRKSDVISPKRKSSGGSAVLSSTLISSEFRNEYTRNSSSPGLFPNIYQQEL